MAVDGTQLISPVGEIDPSLFPSDGENELPERLDAYLLEAEGKVTGVSDEGKKAWAYYRAYRAIYIRLSSTPSARFDDQGEVRYSDKQIENFNTLAEKYLAEWEEITTGTDESSRILQQTASVTTTVKY
jgi:hypothetical protein